MKSSLIIAILLLLSPTVARTADRPNILLLMAEDTSARIGAFGDQVAVTPNLDQLAEQGVRYTNTFTTAGVCAPSRAAHILGMHQISWGGQHMRTSSRPAGGYQAVPPVHMKAYPELLRTAGYYTYTDTKLDYQFSGPLAGSDPTSIWSDQGRSTSWQQRNPGQPFFGLINFNVSHESGTFAPLGHWPESPMHFVMQVMRWVSFGQPSDTMPVTPEAIKLPPYYPDIEPVRREMARHYNNIHKMDAEVGELLAQLDRDGLADNTIVIWTTDHGDGLPRAKRELYDSGIHVPMIIHWPEKWRPADVKPGGKDERLISFIDLAPTVLTLAGVSPPDYLQGKIFHDPEADHRKYVYASRDRIDEVEDRQRAVRDTQYKYIRSWHPQVAGGHTLAFRDIQAMTRAMRAMWHEGTLTTAQARWFEPVGKEQLYDIDDDPYELNNLVANKTYQPELKRLRTTLDNWLMRVGDTSEVSEADMVAALQCDSGTCVTPPPNLAWSNNELQITANPVGASIIYRINEGDWNLYTRAFEPQEKSHIEARAIRYGWEPSESAHLHINTRK